MITMIIFYNSNKDFKTYVDKYCKKHGISVETALTHRLIKEVAEQYGKKVDSLRIKNFKKIL